jgi:hypothetical protein
LVGLKSDLVDSTPSEEVCSEEETENIRRAIGRIRIFIYFL